MVEWQYVRERPAPLPRATWKQYIVPGRSPVTVRLDVDALTERFDPPPWREE
jgi:hypothetical protein